ncbi:MAG: hypothetical protein AVDCRST_MAG56-5221 [uncultured Cytophagales bacterium]|uniref:DinB-like domain-containing protein n=1 Tax=uncultured Cytophagales bacterium TaxID=158755 RepID=A0A6J4K8V1_9SPHI|nr:MAG: hypothetical protein AVDCRST_MAG56-5221 [uncultured Cytophagales bacterium]
MTQPDYGYVFGSALDTFKAFDDLTVANSGEHGPAFPTSTWQILNHLIAWQAYQLGQLRGDAPGRPMGETDTWNGARTPPSEAVLRAAVEQFEGQLAAIGSEVRRVTATGDASADQLKIIQELSLHLSFHLGEVVLMRRMQGSYPLPHQMKAFLQP